MSRQKVDYKSVAAHFVQYRPLINELVGRDLKVKYRRSFFCNSNRLYSRRDRYPTARAFKLRLSRVP